MNAHHEAESMDMQGNFMFSEGVRNARKRANQDLRRKCNPGRMGATADGGANRKMPIETNIPPILEPLASFAARGEATPWRKGGGAEKRGGT